MRAALFVPVLPPIVTSVAVRGPVAVGVLRPRVVLPDGLAESISSDSLFEIARSRMCAISFAVTRGSDCCNDWLAPCSGRTRSFITSTATLTQAREEVCDNHVLKFGDPCNYARTLLALTTVCRPLGIARPGLGLLATRWTLADRVAGIIDPRRISMTSTTFRLKIALASVLAVTVLSASPSDSAAQLRLAKRRTL